MPYGKANFLFNLLKMKLYFSEITRLYFCFNSLRLNTNNINLLILSDMVLQKPFCKVCILKNFLKKSWAQKKSNSNIIIKSSKKYLFYEISCNLFQINHYNQWNKMIKKCSLVQRIDTFVYLKKKKPLIIHNFHATIIGKILLNSVKHVFEEVYQQIKAHEKNYKVKKKKNLLTKKENWQQKELVRLGLYSIKKKMVENVFDAVSFSCKLSKPIHFALDKLKVTQYQNFSKISILNYKIKKRINRIYFDQLKSFLSYNYYSIKFLFFKELNKILNINPKVTRFDFCNDKNELKNNMPPFFLFHIYMYELDQYQKRLSSSIKKHLKFDENTKTRVDNTKSIITNLVNICYTVKSIKSKERPLIKDVLALKKDNYKKNCNIQCIRYQENFFVSILGSLKLAIETQTDINNFIQNNLYCISNKKVIQYGINLVTLLGHQIWQVYLDNEIKVKSKRFAVKTKYRYQALDKFELQNIKLATAFTDRIRHQVQKKKKKVLKIHFEKTTFKDLVLAFKDISQLLPNLSNTALNYNKNLILNNQTLRRWDKIISKKAKIDEKIVIDAFYQEFIILRYYPSYGLKRLALEFNKLQKEFELRTMILIKSFFDKKMIEWQKKKSNNHNVKNVKLVLRNQKAHQFLIPRKPVGLDLQKNKISQIDIKVNLKNLIKIFRIKGFIHPTRDLPCSCIRLLLRTESKMIKYYNEIIYSISYWFMNATNFNRVNSIFESVLKISCRLTLKRKFKLQKIRQIEEIYGENITIYNFTEKRSFRS